MIDSFKRIGEELTKDFSNLPEIERKKAVLDLLTLPIKEKYKINKENEKPIYEIIINFDTNKNKIFLRVGEQLRKDKRTNYFGFKAGSGPSGKKTYFTTNNLSYHLSNTINDTIEYIDKDIKGFDYDFSKFKNFLITIRNKFYIKENKKYIINRKLYSDNIDSEIDYFLSKIGITKKEFSDNYKIFSLHFNGKSILNTEYFIDYINLRYYHAIERFFKSETKKGVRDKKISHLSSLISSVTKNVDIPIKFYTSTDNIYFENLNKNGSYKSFTINQREYEQILIGSLFVMERLQMNFNQIQYILIPKSELFFKELKFNTGLLKKSVQSIEKKGFDKETEKLQKILKFNKQNFYFDMLFFKKGKQDVNVFKIISNLSTLHLEEIRKNIDSINLSQHHRNFKINDFSLNTLWTSLYSQLIKDASKDNKVKIYRSDFLDYLDIIYSKRYINESKLLRDFFKNIRKGYYVNKKEEDLLWNCFETLIFFKKMNILRGVKMEKNSNTFLKLNNKGLQEFFDNYPEIFKEDLIDGYEKRGLVLLGYLVNQIVWAQRSKNMERSSTFLDKINYEGFKANKIPAFINEVIEFLKIYSTKEKPLLRYNEGLIVLTQELLIKLERSKLSKEQITYYILLGNFLGSQIGKVHSKTGGKQDDNKE